jgi:hypothetical protein
VKSQIRLTEILNIFNRIAHFQEAGDEGLLARIAHFQEAGDEGLLAMAVRLIFQVPHRN